MRLKYYKLTLRQMGINKPFVFFIILIAVIMGICSLCFNRRIEPTLKALCHSNAKSIATISTNKAVYENIKDIKYEDLIKIEKDVNNKITAISANVMKMNLISTNVTTKIDEELTKTCVSEIVLPIGSIIGFNFLGGYGPKVDIKTVQTGSVDVKFKSDFTTTGINQTKHSIILEVSTSVMILAPFYTNTETFVNSIVIAETIIVGNIPDAYYDIDGENVGPMDIVE